MNKTGFLKQLLIKRVPVACLSLLLALSPVMEAAAEEVTIEEVTIETGTATQAMDNMESAEDTAQEINAIEADDDNWETIYINSVSDLERFARNCRLDVWSQNKKVYLTADLDLDNKEYVSIPTFGGYFDGKGYTISGFTISDAISYTGLFSYTQESAIICNLNVKGSITPSGKQIAVGGIVGDNAGLLQNCSFHGTVKGNDYTGAIVGFNELTGGLVDCESQGAVSGMHFTGGIAGQNLGNIRSCTNRAQVNVTSIDPTVSLDDINVQEYAASILSIGESENNKKASAEVINSTVDTGGIAGNSTGVIQYCTNMGTIGYEHVGYNIGGIAGRQSGYLYACQNKAEVYGRKDVGGITGQAEPYVAVDFKKDIVYQLSENINKLHDLVNQAIADAGTESDTVSGRLSIIKDFTDQALSDTGYLADRTIEWTDGMVGAANEAISRVDYVMDESAKKDGLLDQVNYASGNVRNAATQLGNVAGDLDIYQYMSEEEKAQYDQAKDNLQKATSDYAGYSSDAYRGYENYYLDKTRMTKMDETGTNKKYISEGANSLLCDENDLRPCDKDGTVLSKDYNSLTYKDYIEVDSWVHYTKDDSDPGNVIETKSAFPASDGSDQETLDQALLTDTANAMSAEEATIESDVQKYADAQYLLNHTGSISFAADTQDYINIMSNIILAHTDEMSEDVRQDAVSAVNYAESAAGNLHSAGTEVKSIADNLNGRSDITLPQLGDDYRLRSGSLVSNLQGLSDNMGYLNGEMSTANTTLLADFAAINDQFNVIMLLYTDAIDGVLDMDYTSMYEDKSEEGAEDSKDATVADCINYGSIRGDLDVSGIVGTMAIEYDFDLESDVTGIEDAKVNSSYLTRCVLRNNVNRGEVISQKNYAGGICGLQEMGTILTCESYGKVESNSGDYVGGIAGKSYSCIKESFAKCLLSGGEYVAGITGSGSNITDCCAMVRIDQATSFYGAIAGAVEESSEVSHNFFVGDDLAGIDRISFSGQAEPISYETLLERADLPVDFQKMTVSYYMDDKLVKKQDYNYGAVISQDDLPQMQAEDGYYADWGTDELGVVEFDKIITAESKRYLTTLAGEETRENGQSIFLVDGKFEEADHLGTVSCSTEELSIKNVVEHYTLAIPSDGSSEHIIRYQPPEEIKGDIEIYLRTDGNWTKLKLDTMGSYQLFTIEGTNAEIVVCTAENGILKYIWFVLGGAVIFALFFAVIIRKKRKKKSLKKMEQKAEK